MNPISQHLASRGLSPSDFLVITKLPVDVLNDDFDVERLSASQLKVAAQVLGIPEYLLFSTRSSKLKRLPLDFRSTGNAKVVHTKYSLSAVYQSYSNSEFISLIERHVNIKGRFPDLREDQTPIERMRVLFNCDSASDLFYLDPISLFKKLRTNAEDSGLFVFVDDVVDTSFRGFCFKDDHRNFVFINRRHFNVRSRIFTLAHEVAHLLQGHPGIIDPVGHRSSVERQTNRLAAEFLISLSTLTEYLPANAEKQEIPELLSYLHSRLPFSKFFLAMRLQELGGSFSGIVNKWLKLVNVKDLPNSYGTQELAQYEHEIDQLESQSDDDLDVEAIRRQGSGGRQVSRLGSRTLETIEIARQQNIVSVFDVQSSLGLPAKYYEKTIASLRRQLAEVQRYGPS
ncbi:ImmA/IrrE family metallo-endopeptidase [Pelagibacterium sp. H642]|uniref:ImmA/IrrE family metallo-endopeptidase n=1 Tax=Pelagibacterium sp. H642 TaxID=1881069 RepID=UPI0028152429|nr:ImmA/IrrE family metallo-endopeptidase [Pelagibacterium sp. H642]WMT89720.1 ImmA/IrrE family metallo-endopeptidase [Pelagibacterium sp. H642]